MFHKYSFRDSKQNHELIFHQCFSNSESMFALYCVVSSLRVSAASFSPSNLDVILIQEIVKKCFLTGLLL